MRENPLESEEPSFFIIFPLIVARKVEKYVTNIIIESIKITYNYFMSLGFVKCLVAIFDQIEIFSVLNS
jgi:hypothetical protein